MYTAHNTEDLMAFDFNTMGEQVTVPDAWQDPKHAAQAALDAINHKLMEEASVTPYGDAEVLHAMFVQPPADLSDQRVLVFTVCTDECMIVTFQVQTV